MQSRQLLVSGGADLESSVRRGDIYALMIQECVKHNHFEEAKQLFVELKQLLNATSNMPISYYVSKECVEALGRGLGISASVLLPTIPQESSEEKEEVEEEIVEE